MAKNKDIWSTRWMFMLLSLAGAFLVAVIVVIGCIFWLKGFTRHGEEVEIPNFVGMYVEEAEIMAQSQGVSIQVVDSTYTRKVPLGAIMEQNPEIGAKAKKGRAVYVVINAKSIRQIPMPNVIDMTLRQAEATLQSMGFVLNETEFLPSESSEVMDVKMNGKTVQPGTRLKEGDKLTIVAGSGSATGEVVVPDLTGKTIEAARNFLLGHQLVLGMVDYAEQHTEENEASFIVFGQTPKAGETVDAGSHVSIKVTTSVEKVVAGSNNTKDEDDFF